MKEKIGFGTIGYGMIAKTHLVAMQGNRIQHPNETAAYPRALCTRNPEKNRDLPYEVLYTDARELIADKEVQIVDVCTPNNLHLDAGIAAFEEGKAVYMEKPLASTLTDVKMLCDAAKRTGLPNQAALVMRFHATTNRMKDQIDAGVIGDIIHFRCCMFHVSYLDPNRPTSWRQQFAMSGGGSLIDLGVHMIDLVRYLMGEVVSVQASSRTVFKERAVDSTRQKFVPNDTDEYMCAMLQMENGAVGVVESSRVSESARQNTYLEVFGTKGSLLLEMAGGGNVFLVKSGGIGAVRLNGSDPGKAESEVKGYRPEPRQSMGAFVDVHAAAIRNICSWHQGEGYFSGTPTFEEAFRSQAVVDACHKSADSGKTQCVVHFPAAEENL